VKDRIPLSLRVRIVTALLPRSLWYKALVLFCNAQTRTTRLLGRRDAVLQDSLILDYWLVQLTALGPFTISYKAVGSEHLRRREDEVSGVVYCGIHLPCYTVAMRAMEDLQASADFAIAAPISIGPDNKYPLVGLRARLPAVPPGRAAFMKVRTELAKNGVVCSMIDSHIGEPLTHHLLQLSGKVGARIVFFWTEVERRGNIRVIFALPPHEICDTDAKVNENLRAIDIQRQRILAML
jgi:hypothetical protein